jgi:hypothetical protein
MAGRAWKSRRPADVLSSCVAVRRTTHLTVSARFVEQERHPVLPAAEGAADEGAPQQDGVSAEGQELQDVRLVADAASARMRRPSRSVIPSQGPTGVSRTRGGAQGKKGVAADVARVS